MKGTVPQQQRPQLKMSLITEPGLAQLQLYGCRLMWADGDSLAKVRAALLAAGNEAAQKRKVQRRFQTQTWDNFSAMQRMSDQYGDQMAELGGFWFQC